MKTGTLYGIGLGPGDPELLTLKAVWLLGSCRTIYVPTSRFSKEAYVEETVKRHAAEGAEVREVTFSLDPDLEKRKQHWKSPAAGIVETLLQGGDVAFVTLGDPLLYSTWIYLLRAVRRLAPESAVETVPGVSSVSLCAALTSFPLGKGKEPVTFLPLSDDLDAVRSAVRAGGTVALMKIGRRLPLLLDLLEEEGVLGGSVFVARAGLPGQSVETDLGRLRHAPPETGNLAVILIHATVE